MAKPDLGTKRVCGECGAKFYDLNKDPIVCPKCGTPYDVAVVTAPAGRVKPQKAAEPAPAEDEEEDLEDENLVPLEDADAEEEDTGRAGADEEDADDDIPEMDDEVEDDADTEDEFLEDEEEDDDVSGLIDNDIEDDRE